MITIENLAAFVLGMAVVYMMFRAMGVFLLLAFLGLASPASAQTNLVPVYVAEPSAVDVWPAAAAGFGFGLTVCGFGWIFRSAKKVGGYSE